MAGVTELGYLGIGVSDLGAWEKFSRDVLGVEIPDDSERGLMYLRMDVNHHRYALRENGHDDLDYVGWQVSTPQDLDEIAERLESAGVKVTLGSSDEASDRRVHQLIKCEDPSGIATEIYCGPQMWETRPFMPTRPMNGGFNTGLMGMGHIVVFQRDNQKALTFYRDLLGLRMSDVLGPAPSNVMFLHANPRHHSIAIIQAPATPKRIHHFMMECKQLDDVGQAYDVVKKKEIPIVMTMGRHIADNMISFYMSNPAGFCNEYGWGGIAIDDATWQVRNYDSGDSIWGHKMIP